MLGEKKPLCPVCEEDALEWQKKNIYLKCEACGAETWPDEKKLKELKRKKNERMAGGERAVLQLRAGQLYDENGEVRLIWSLHLRPPEVLPSGPSKPGSGSKVKNKRKKPKRRTTSERWEDEMRNHK